MSWFIYIIGCLLALSVSAGSNQESDFESPIVLDTLKIDGASNTPFVFEESFQFGNDNAKIHDWSIGDYDGDSWDELVTASAEWPDDKTVSIIWHDFPNGNAFTVAQRNFTDFSKLIRSYQDDLNGDGAVDVSISCKKGSEAWGLIFSVRDHLIARTASVRGPDLNASGQWDGVAEPCRAVDLDRDGDAELLVRVFSGFDKKPRGLIAYDVTGQDTLWMFRAGPPIGSGHVFPIWDSESEKLLLLIGAYSVSNGSTEGGIDDGDSYLFLVDANGRLLKRKRLAGSCTNPQMVMDDIDQDGIPEVIVTLSGNMQYANANRNIWIFNPLTLEIKKSIRTGAYLEGAPIVIDLDGDGWKEIVTRTSSEVLIFNRDLSLKIQIPGAEDLNVTQIDDITGDGKPDLLGTAQRGKVLVLFSPNGSILAQKQFRADRISQPAILHWGPRRQQVVVSTGHQLLGFTLRRSDSASSGAASRGAASREWPAAVLFVVAGLFIGILLSAIAVSRIYKTGISSILFKGRGDGSKKERSQAEYRIALTQITAFGHGEPGAVLARAATLLQAANDDLLSDAEWRRAVSETVSTMRKTLPQAVNEIIEFGKVLKDLGFTPKDILSEFHSIQKDLDHLTESLNSKKIVSIDAFRSAGLRIKRFDDYFRDLRMAFRISFTCDVLDAVNATFSMKRQFLREHNILNYGVKVSGEGNFLAHIDPHRLQYEILDDLITNAALAMSDSQNRRLTIDIRQEMKTIEIRVIDTGKGIEPAIRKTLFDRGVTTKKEGGLGLYQARMAVKDFGGRIFVEVSEPRIGTTMTIIVPSASEI
ncbi:MAG: hypothetical protein KJ970_13655 [Candidatus Eisenbacteria bacterium]|uniref:histidine kinase n=1 Tax=Eiseniibacteriota bacterium TaxID=2212470 RepID=A0A948W782_UNCEI|nr:hypothetical protein [Candidatus Eisenbacteria bacterium]MBU1949679.1 hypothetical protein [Candidatus Eisenbacteria bacterium]MBU2691960.1 hypothetical protein [Candidatus Eisenbacteria bacterium]